MLAGDVGASERDASVSGAGAGCARDAVASLPGFDRSCPSRGVADVGNGIEEGAAVLEFGRSIGPVAGDEIADGPVGENSADSGDKPLFCAGCPSTGSDWTTANNCSFVSIAACWISGLWCARATSMTGISCGANGMMTPGTICRNSPIQCRQVAWISSSTL